MVPPRKGMEKHMNSTSKRFLLWALTLLLLTPGLLSCGEKGGQEQTAAVTDTDTDTMAETDTETQRLKPDLPVQDYDGYTFSAVHWKISDDWKSRLVNDFYVDELNGDALNDAVYNRNALIAETYNIQYHLEYADVNPMIKKMVQSGDDTYDIAYQVLTQSTAMVTDGLLYNLYDVPHLALDMPWWDQNSVEALSVGRTLRMASAAISVEDKNATSAILFNKDIARDHGVEDLYAIVTEGVWTMDRMKVVYENVTTDLDGDGKMTLEDLWGFLSKRDAGYCVYFGAGGTFITKNEDGTLSDSFKQGFNIEVLQKVQDMMSDETAIYDQHRGSQDAKPVDDTPFRELFLNGHGLFFWSRFDDVLALRDMDAPFGILPIPKYDEAQERYASLVSRHTTALLGIPISVQDIERTGILIEALSAESLYTVTPAYYETTLKGKATRDSDSDAMVDLIFANRIYDLGDIYDIGEWPGNVLTNLITTKKKNVVSSYESYQKKIATAIEKFTKAYSGG